jgi:voltage-gated potassium channel
MSLSVMDGSRRDGTGARGQAGLSAVSLPSRTVTPLRAVGARALLATALLVVSTLIVYLGRDGYRDAAHPGQPLSFLGAAYYSAVTLSTTGYGDIVPVTNLARLVNVLVITPIRVVFLIVLIGTTLEVLTERTRRGWRIARWRSRVTNQTVVVGYGTKGRGVLTTLRDCGAAGDTVLVVDHDQQEVSAANRAGVAAVAGDATRREVLEEAQIDRASRVIVAVGRDDTAVLITLTARQLNGSATIIAAVRESENEPLLRQSGADQVIVSEDAAGRMLGIAAMEPGAGRVIAGLLGGGLDLTERRPAAAELGRPARQAAGTVIAVLRGGMLLVADDPQADALQDGDVLVTAGYPGRPAARTAGRA